LFETVIEMCWDMYVHGLQQLGAPVTPYTLSECAPNQQLLDFVQQAGSVIDEIALHCGLNLPTQPTDASQSASAPPQSTQLELSRHHMIGRMLSDVEINSQAASSTDRDNTTPSSSAGLFAAGQTSAKTGFWGGSDEATYSPSSAEKRRREDIYLALSISVLVLSCSSANQR
jgi:hypothetical protein